MLAGPAASTVRCPMDDLAAAPALSIEQEAAGLGRLQREGRIEEALRGAETLGEALPENRARGGFSGNDPAGSNTLSGWSP